MDCGKLRDIIRRGQRFGYGSDFAKLPKNGVYIMFEKGETAHGGDRTVRIGINKKQDKLQDRIENHYNGKKGKSVLRKHIMTALNTSSKEEITDHIRSNITFAVIRVDDKSQREKLEKELIATVAQCRDCSSSDNWLGKKCAAPKIANGKLWNVAHLKSTPLSDERLKLLYDGLVLKCDTSVDFDKFVKG